MRSWMFLLLGFSFCTTVDALVQCEQKNVSVQLPKLWSLAESTNDSIATWFWWKQGAQLNPNKVVHLTLHGYTYDHTYWAFPYQSPRYSYVDYVIEQSNGDIVVLNVDRVGCGLSSKPSAVDVTIESNANAISQLIAALADGVYQQTRFTNVILVSHSLGTLIAWTTASSPEYNRNIRGLIATGWLHSTHIAGITAIAMLSYPAKLDSKFGARSIPLGYLTTNPLHNTRQFLFYEISATDPGVIALDEELKQTGTVGEVSTIGAARAPALSLRIPTTIPILVVIGENDFIFCKGENTKLSCANSSVIQQREQSSYPSSIETFVLRRSGHNLNLHMNAQDWFQQAFTWTKRHFLPNCSGHL